MLSGFTKFSAYTVQYLHGTSSLVVFLKDRYGLRWNSSKSELRRGGNAQKKNTSGRRDSGEVTKHEQDKKSRGNKSENAVTTPLKVTVLGANGASGQILSMFLKQCPLIGTLSLYDVTPISGTALDISHIDTSCRVHAYSGKHRLKDALKDSDIVIMMAGIAQTPSMSRGYLFCKNAEIAYDLAQYCSEMCPRALLGVLTNPINSIVPVVCEVLKKNGCYDSNRVLGIASPHVVRASTFVAERMNLDPAAVIVPVIGGASASTLIPVLSQTKPSFRPHSAFFTEDVFKFLACRIRTATLDVAKAKGGYGSASLSTAYSTARFTHSLAKGLCGKQAIEFAYVNSTVLPSCPYFITPVELGPNGIKRNCGLPRLSKFEESLLDEVVPTIITDINLGKEFVNEPHECV